MQFVQKHAALSATPAKAAIVGGRFMCALRRNFPASAGLEDALMR
jgi:hypothetical protein